MDPFARLGPEEAEGLARGVLAIEAKRFPFMRPPITPAIFHWQEESHYGGTQGPLAPDADPEIVFITKTSRAMPRVFVDALLEAQPDRLVLLVEQSIDFTGRRHILRRLGNALTWLTKEQDAWAASFIPRMHFIEVDP